MKSETREKIYLTIIGIMILGIIAFYVERQDLMDKAQWEAIQSLREYHVEKK